MNLSCRQQRQRRGTYLVEFACVAPVFFLIVLGIIEFGRVCMVTELLTEAARQGCRRAVIEGTSTKTVQQTAIGYLTSAGISGENAAVYVNGQPAGTTSLQTIPPYTEITVVVTVPAGNVSWTPPFFLSGALTGLYSMRRE